MKSFTFLSVLKIIGDYILLSGIEQIYYVHCKHDAHHFHTDTVYQYVTSIMLLALVSGTLSDTNYIFYNRVYIQFHLHKVTSRFW
jgi:hypothetical protein